MRSLAFCLGSRRAPADMDFGGSSRRRGAHIIIIILKKIRNLQATPTERSCYRNRLSFEEGFQLFLSEVLQNACNIVGTLPGPSNLIEVLHDNS
jgi:hypothetical protein